MWWPKVKLIEIAFLWTYMSVLSLCKFWLVRLLQMSPLHPSARLHPAPAPLLSDHHHTVVHVYGSCSLADPFTFFHPVPPPPFLMWTAQALEIQRSSGWILRVGNALPKMVNDGGWTSRLPSAKVRYYLSFRCLMSLCFSKKKAPIRSSSVMPAITALKTSRAVLVQFLFAL